MRSKKLLFGGIAAVLAVAAAIWYFTQVVQVVLAKPEVSYQCIKDKTLFNVLVLENRVVFEDTALGKMIISINGLEQGGGKYWSFSIDGQPTTKSAFETICSGTETITWQLK